MPRYERQTSGQTDSEKREKWERKKRHTEQRNIL